MSIFVNVVSTEFNPQPSCLPGKSGLEETEYYSLNNGRISSQGLLGCDMCNVVGY